MYLTLPALILLCPACGQPFRPTKGGGMACGC